MNDDKRIIENLIKFYKKQKKFHTISLILNSCLLLIFIIVFHKDLSVVLLLSAVLLFMWIYVGIKMISVVKEIKKLEEKPD